MEPSLGRRLVSIGLLKSRLENVNLLTGAVHGKEAVSSGNTQLVNPYSRVVRLSQSRLGSVRVSTDIDLPAPPPLSDSAYQLI